MVIVVIEDRPEFVRVANQALAGHTVKVATTYVEGAELLGHYAEGQQGVIVLTDMCLPASAELAVSDEGQAIRGLFRDTKYHLDTPSMGNALMRAEQFAPMGFLLAGQALRLGLPVQMLSQGDCHFQFLGFVRYCLRELTSRNPEVVARNSFDSLFSNLMAQAGQHIDKSQGETWIKAAEESAGKFGRVKRFMAACTPEVAATLFGA